MLLCLCFFYSVWR